MALLKYLKVKKMLLLPDLEGLLSAHISTECIKEANREVANLNEDDQLNKRSPYLKATPKQIAIVGRYAAKNGIVNSIRRFQKDFPTDLLK